MYVVNHKVNNVHHWEVGTIYVDKLLGSLTLLA
jgi:hypothetical protein